MEIANLGDDLQKYLVLSDLQARNETLCWPERLQAVSPCLAR
jgi:hypothetical protein